MLRNAFYILAAVFCLSVSVSCIDRPAEVLSDEQMVDLLVDVHRSEGLLDLQSSSSYADEEYQQSVMAAVLVKHGVTRAQYDSSLMWYANHLKLFVRVYSHVEERLVAEHDLWTQRIADFREFAVSEAGDSVNVWTLPDYLSLDKHNQTMMCFWEIPKDSNYMAGDTLRWSFDVSMLTHEQKLFASMSFRADESSFGNSPSKYRDVMKTLPVGSSSLLIEHNGPQQFEVVPDSMKSFSSVILSLVMISPDSIQSPTYLRDISLKRYHPHE